MSEKKQMKPNKRNPFMQIDEGAFNPSETIGLDRKTTTKKKEGGCCK